MRDKIKTEVERTGEAQFDCDGKFKGYPLQDTDGEISQSRASNILSYAEKRAVNIGLNLIDWEATVGTMDCSSAVDDRYYYVVWENAQNTKITLSGILTKKGKPFLDHGFSLDEE